MSQHVEPMDIDNIVNDFDDKENAFHHINVLQNEKGFEDLDMSEVNMRLRYSITPNSSPMSKSYTTTNESKHIEILEDKKQPESPNLTSSLNSTLTKTLPLQSLPNEQCMDSRTSSVLQPIGSTAISDITVPVPVINDLENVSLPSSSSSIAHTPEATTPTKDMPKSDGSPIMRGLKTVLNMFRPSQSPVPSDEVCGSRSELLSTNELNLSNSEFTGEPHLVSTPKAGSKDVNLFKRVSSHRDSIAFKDDLERELCWKDDSTILFDEEKIPIHKLLLPQSVTNNSDFNQQIVDCLDSTVEYMDISYNDSVVNKTVSKMPDVQKSEVNPESDGEFVDCETTFLKNESQVFEEDLVAKCHKTIESSIQTVSPVIRNVEDVAVEKEPLSRSMHTTDNLKDKLILEDICKDTFKTPQENVNNDSVSLLTNTIAHMYDEKNQLEEVADSVKNEDSHLNPVHTIEVSTTHPDDVSTNIRKSLPRNMTEQETIITKPETNISVEDISNKNDEKIVLEPQEPLTTKVPLISGVPESATENRQTIEGKSLSIIMNPQEINVPFVNTNVSEVASNMEVTISSGSNQSHIAETLQMMPLEVDESVSLHHCVLEQNDVNSLQMVTAPQEPNVPVENTNISEVAINMEVTITTEPNLNNIPDHTEVETLQIVPQEGDVSGSLQKYISEQQSTETKDTNILLQDTVNENKEFTDSSLEVAITTAANFIENNLPTGPNNNAGHDNSSSLTCDVIQQHFIHIDESNKIATPAKSEEVNYTNDLYDQKSISQFGLSEDEKSASHVQVDVQHSVAFPTDIPLPADVIEKKVFIPDTDMNIQDLSNELNCVNSTKPVTETTRESLETNIVENYEHVNEAINILENIESMDVNEIIGDKNVAVKSIANINIDSDLELVSKNIDGQTNCNVPSPNETSNNLSSILNEKVNTELAIIDEQKKESLENTNTAKVLNLTAADEDQQPSTQAIVATNAPEDSNERAGSEEVVASESNSPFVSVSVELDDFVPEVEPSENFEEIENPFTTKSNINVSPPISPKISAKGQYNFNFDEIDDPFATKTKISASPPLGNSLNQTLEPISKPTKEFPSKINDKNRRKSQPERKKPFCMKKKLDSNHGKVSSFLPDVVNNNTDTTIAIEKILRSDTEKPEISQNKHSAPSVPDPDALKVGLNVNKTNEEQSNEVTEMTAVNETLSMDIDFEVEHDADALANMDAASIDDRRNDNVAGTSSEQSIYLSAGTSSSGSVTKNVFNIPEIEDISFNPFATKSKIRESPPVSLNVTKEVTKAEDTDNLNSTVTEIKLSARDNISMNESGNQLPENPDTHVELPAVHMSNTSSSSKNSDEREDTVRELNTEDEDTIEGPFLEADDLEDNLADFDEDKGNMMQFNEMPQQVNDDAGEFFIDAEAFEFLLNQNKSNCVADSGKESLFLKFDPLFAKRMSSDGVVSALNKIQKKQSTPKKSASVSQSQYPKSPVAGPSNFDITLEMNKTVEESNDELNITVAKPMMVVNPAVNPIVTPRTKLTTPPRANRRSITFTSPAMAVIDRLLSMSANTSALEETILPRVNRDHNETDIALMQLRELLAEKEIHVHQLKCESKELKDRLSTLESQMRSLEAESGERLKKINDLNDKLCEKTKLNRSMADVVEEYERTIASLIAETEQDKKLHAEERMRLIKERDEQTAHLASMEVSFNDLHSKYEKSKQTILICKSNEDAYKKSAVEFEESLSKMHSNYELLKQHATSKLNHANQELEKLNRAHEAEVLKLNAMIKRKDLHITSLEESLAQKTKANEELTAICDELINKVG